MNHNLFIEMFDHSDSDLTVSPAVTLSDLDTVIAGVDERNVHNVEDVIIRQCIQQELLDDFGCIPEKVIKTVDVTDEFVKSVIGAVLPAVETIKPSKPNPVTDVSTTRADLQNMLQPLLSLYSGCQGSRVAESIENLLDAMQIYVDGSVKLERAAVAKRKRTI